MNPIVLIEDRFFEQPELVRKMILDRGFKDVVSPVDQVTYPDICDLQDTAEAFKVHLEKSMLQPVKINLLFARMMKAGVVAPHKVHCDANLGKYGALIYLTLNNDAVKRPRGILDGLDYGTGFYTHKEFGPREKVLNTNLGEDHNSFENWNEYAFVNAKFNRILIYGSDYYHCAFPLNGFGDAPENARLVLTCFFDI